MHESAYNFVKSCVTQPYLRVLEIGSYDVNGSVRGLFPRAEYVGLDIRGGPGVDRVWDGETLPPDLTCAFDCVVSTETLEHAANPEAVVQAMIQALVPSGDLIVTAASPERTPHGCDGGPVVPAHEHYQGIGLVALKQWTETPCHILSALHLPTIGDVYLFARKRGD